MTAGLEKWVHKSSTGRPGRDPEIHNEKARKVDTGASREDQERIQNPETPNFRVRKVSNGVVQEDWDRILNFTLQGSKWVQE